jgi:protein O-mannosyl-transferase
MPLSQLSSQQKIAGMKAPTGFTARLIGATLLVGLAVLITHWPALSAKALSFDDHEYLLENHLVQQPSWNSVGRFLGEVLEPSTVQGYYQPLTMISLMLDAAMGASPENLRPFHRTSLILHAVNSAVICALLYALLGHLPAAMLAALLFGLHPMTVETIPWIGERKTLLAAFFALCCLIVYVRYTRAITWPKYSLCMGLYILALMSKPTTTPLPVLMLLLDVWPLKRFSKRAVLEKVPYLVVAAIFSIITVVSQRRTLGASLPNEQNALEILLLLCHNVVFYLKNIFWPVHLSSHYPIPKPIDFTNPAILIGVIGTTALIILLVLSIRWTKSLLVGGAIFYIGLLPTMGIIGFTTVVAADKYAYVPAIGLLLILVALLKLVWEKKQPAIVIGTCLLLAGTEAVLTRRYLSHWKNTEALCRYMVEVTPEAAIPHNSLANILFEENKTDEAIQHFRKSLELDPRYAYSHYNLANALAKQERREEAIAEYEQALKLRPRLAQAHINLGAVMAQQNRLEEAVAHYEIGLKLRPESSAAHYNVALVLAQLGRIPDAIAHLQIAVKLKPDFIAARQALEKALSIVNSKAK